MNRVLWILFLVSTLCCCSSKQDEGTQSKCGDPFLDIVHCGTCDNVCSSEQSCVEGQCVCPAGAVSCGGECVDLQADSKNCGACEEACPGSTECLDGVCACEGGRAFCGGACVDLDSHAEHCGGCNNFCPFGARCAEARCQCRQGQEECDEICTNILTDASNCGGCGVACGEDTRCEGGQCVCADRSAAICDGVCTKVERDPSNCGGCGQLCPSGASCQRGGCVCSSRSPDVCGETCVDKLRDRENCGDCGERCVGTQLCSAGTCRCPFGGTLCGETCVDIAQDEENCGGCGQSCSGQTCCNGVCEDECTVPPVLVECGDTLVSEGDFLDTGLDSHAVSFELPQNVTSYMVVPHSERGRMFMRDIEGPGGTLDMLGSYSFANANSYLVGDPLALLVPQSPDFAGRVAPGQHTLRMGSNQDFCHAIIPKVGPGTRLDLNLYFVGVAGLNSENFESHSGLQATLERLAEIMAPLQVDVRAARASDIVGEDAQRFSIVRDEDDVSGLVSLSQLPGQDVEERLSLNLFFIDQFGIAGGNVLGISAGIPGVAGLHGMPGTGVIVAGTLLSDPSLAGQVTAHELGHFLGLFHTTEMGGRFFDPLSDTAQCAPNLWSNPGRCPDISNLMFPFAGRANTAVSNAQSLVIHANPLVK